MEYIKRLMIIFFTLYFLLLSIGGAISTQNYLNESQQWQSDLTPVSFSSTVLGDINNDNYLDLIIIGCLTDGSDHCENGVIAKIYIHNGTSFVEDSIWQNNLTGVGIGSLALGDVDNDGDLDLSLIGCTNSSRVFSTNCQGERINKIYINNGTTFTESSQWQSNLTGVTDASSEFGDVNNDGYLDLVMNGATATSRISKIYINNGTSFVEDSIWQNNLTGITEGEISLGDVDNDGDLDLVIVGDDGTGNFINLYINNGTTFTENFMWGGNLLSRFLASSLFGDYNNDGNLDLIICGQLGGDHCDLYQNNGSTLVVNQTEDDTLGGFFRASIGFGDYENDGDLDLAIIGNEVGRSTILENNESDNYQFTRDIFAPDIISDGLLYGSLTWGDVDNDKDLDLIVISGDANLGILVARIYLSNVSLTKNNTKPSPPNSSFSSTYANNILTLSWGNGSDVETNTSGLYYNLRVGNSSNNNSIVSGVYGGSSGGAEGGGGGASGYFGNMMQRKSIALNVQLEVNKTYYWYVQTIDTGLEKSNWSAMQSFNTSADITKPEITINYPSPNSSLHTSNPYFIFNATVTDANLANVTLFADWTGSMIVNETNSSGINGTYIFTKNLTNIADGIYSWYIKANDTLNNSQTSTTRAFYLDRTYPIVNLVSPADSSIWSSSSTVTFSYNVSDVNIANCSLIIDNTLDQTDTSITEDTTQTFTKTLSNAVYTWSINCTDYVGYTNNSANRSLTVSYTASSDTGNGGSSGGGGSTTTKTNATTATNATTTASKELFDIDFSNTSTGSFEAKQGDIKTFSFNNQVEHTIIILTLTDSSATLLITSNPITIQILLGETKQIDINKDGINDIEIKLVSIINGKANFSLKKLAGADVAAKEEIEEEARKQALFDVKVSIVNLFNIIKSGRQVIAEIQAFNVNNIGQVDIVVDYYITSKNDNQKKLVEGSDTLAVEAVTSFVRNLVVPYNTKSGKYLFNVNVKYNNEIMASGKAEFRVIRNYEVIAVIVIVLLVVIVIFVYLWKIKRKEEKIEKKESKLEKKEARLERIIRRLRRRRK